MKSQDILLVFKLLSIEQQFKKLEKKDFNYVKARFDGGWQDWEDVSTGYTKEEIDYITIELGIEDIESWPENSIKGISQELYNDSSSDKFLSFSYNDRLSYYLDRLESARSVRGLAEETGISKSEVSKSIKRCEESGLVFRDFKGKHPRVNKKNLIEFTIHGLKYVFPVKPREVSRGIKTGFSAPVLNNELMSAGDLDLVWPDALGKSKGQAVEPLYKTSTYAVRKDNRLYGLLSLIDAIRLGKQRERLLAEEKLREMINE